MSLTCVFSPPKSPYSRAKKIPVTDRDRKGGKPKKSKDANKDAASKDGETDGKDTAPNSPDGKAATGGAAKKKRKIRLDMHLEQWFLDSTDAYVWIYDPMPWYYWVGGTAIVLGEKLAFFIFLLDLTCVDEYYLLALFVQRRFHRKVK